MKKMLPSGSRGNFCFTLNRGEAVPPIQRLCRWRREIAADGQTGHCRRLAAETKGGKGTVWFPCPLLTPPNPPMRRDSLRSRGETGERGLGSVRRADFGTLLCPEVSLRKPPRITVRGHSVQGANAVAAADRHDADISRTQKEHRFASVLFPVI